jgi:hypothetical protein
MLTGCSHPDPIDQLKADKPQDPVAAKACQGWAGQREAQSVKAALDSTWGPVRAHMSSVTGSPAISSALKLWSDVPDSDYVALCLLDYPKSSLPAGVDGPSHNMVLGVFKDGSSFWADFGN